MLECLFGRDSSRGFILEHFPEQVKPLVINLIWMDKLSQVNYLVVWPLDLVPCLVMRNAGEILFSWLTHDPEDLLELLNFVFALE